MRRGGACKGARAGFRGAHSPAGSRSVHQSNPGILNHIRQRGRRRGRGGDGLRFPEWRLRGTRMAAGGDPPACLGARRARAPAVDCALAGCAVAIRKALGLVLRGSPQGEFLPSGDTDRTDAGEREPAFRAFPLRTATGRVVRTVGMALECGSKRRRPRGVPVRAGRMVRDGKCNGNLRRRGQ